MRRPGADAQHQNCTQSQFTQTISGRLETVAFISTHFLDFARKLELEPPVPTLEFLQVETDEQLASTYQFRSGVAETSLAAATAERLGVSFEQLSALIDRRRESEAEHENVEETAVG